MTIDVPWMGWLRWSWSWYGGYPPIPPRQWSSARGGYPPGPPIASTVPRIPPHIPPQKGVQKGVKMGPFWGVPETPLPGGVPGRPRGGGPGGPKIRIFDQNPNTPIEENVPEFCPDWENY